LRLSEKERNFLGQPLYRENKTIPDRTLRRASSARLAMQRDELARKQPREARRDCGADTRSPPRCGVAAFVRSVRRSPSPAVPHSAKSADRRDEANIFLMNQFLVVRGSISDIAAMLTDCFKCRS
jgi:hypothetical protein